MIFYRSAARRVSTFIMCYVVLLPFGRNATAKRLPLPAISAQAAASTSGGGQRTAASDPLEAAFDHAKLTEPVRQAIRFIMAEADNGKVEIGRLREAHKNSSMNLYAMYLVYDYRAKLAAMLNESAVSTGVLYTNAMLAAGQALYDATRIAYGQYQNPYKLLDMYGEIPDPGNKKKEALIDAGFTILASYDKDPQTRTQFGIGWNPNNPGPALVQRSPSEDLWRTGPAAIAQFYAAALAAPSAHTGPPLDTALHFDANPDAIAFSLKPALPGSTAKDKAAPALPEAAAILASNDPPYKEAARKDPNGTAYMLNEVYPSVLKEYRDLYPQSLLAQSVREGPRPDDPQRPFPAVMADIIAREAKFYSGADLDKVAQAVGNFIAPYLEHAEGSAQPASEAQIRAQLSHIVEAIHNGQNTAEMTALLSRYIHQADQRLFPSTDDLIRARLPHVSPSAHFDSDPADLPAFLQNYVAQFANDPHKYPLTVPAALLASNDPALKEEESHGKEGQTIFVSMETVVASLQKEYFAQRRLAIPPQWASVSAFPELMAAIIVREAKAYSGDDLQRVAQVAGDMIAPNVQASLDGTAGQTMSEQELRAYVSNLIRRIHNGDGEQDEKNALRTLNRQGG